MVAALILFYGPGFLLAPIFREYFTRYYSLYEYPYLYVAPIGLIFFAAFFSIYYFWCSSPNLKFGLKLPALALRAFFCVSVIVFVCLSVIFFINYDVSFRHKGRLSEAGALTVSLFAVRMIVQYYVLLCILQVVSGGKLNAMAKLLLVLIGIGCALSLTASLQVAMFLLIMALLAGGGIFSQRLHSIQIGRVVVIAIGLIIVVPGVLIVGLGNKVGFELLLSEEGLGFVYDQVGVVVPRAATSFMSTAVLAANDLISYDRAVNAMESIRFTIANRTAYLFGMTFDEGLFDTINRANYLEVFAEHARRAGASPGVLASLFYTPFFPFNLILLPLFYAILLHSVFVLVRPGAQCGFLGCIAVFYLLIPFFEAPLDVFYIFSPIFVFFLIVILGGKLIDLDRLFGRADRHSKSGTLLGWYR